MRNRTKANSVGGVYPQAQRACRDPKNNSTPLRQRVDRDWRREAVPVSCVAIKPVVLVVEDEPFILAYAADILRGAGLDVVLARNADEAIVILEARKDIRIVLTDIDMPGSMDGLRLAKAIRDRWPPIELILTSGKVHLPKKWLPERSQFLPKPYDADKLVGTIKSFGAL